MGLDVSHDCWHGAYSAFHRWRHGVAKAAGIPLDLMEGYWGHLAPGGQDGERIWQQVLDWLKPSDSPPGTPLSMIFGPKCGSPLGPFAYRYLQEIDQWLPLKWSLFAGDPLVDLLNHSDCDGYLTYEQAGRIARRLEELLPVIAAYPDDNGHIGNWRTKTQAWIDGLKVAHSKRQRVTFH